MSSSESIGGFNVNRAAILLVLIPTTAIAHGEEVLLFPLGTIAALLAVCLTPFPRGATRMGRAVGFLGAIVASIPFWGMTLPEALRNTDTGIFLVGFVPSILIGFALVWVARRRSMN